MLTADSLWYTRRGERITPRLIDPGNPDWLTSARTFIELAQDHLGRSRGELESALRGSVPAKMHPKAARALVRLVLDQCAFQAPEGIDPPRLREALCDAAALAWRAENPTKISAEDSGNAQAAETIPGGKSWREALLDSVAGEMGLTRSEAEAGWFADLAENLRLTALEPITPESLLLRFNTAQVQGLLLGAERVWVTSPWPPPRRLRQLMRYVKFFGLLFSTESVPARGTSPPGLSLILDGPLSILASGTRYGLQLAQFFPALLLWDEPWNLRAELRLGRDRKRGILEIERQPWLRSHYADQGMWVPGEVVRFVKDFNAPIGGKAGKSVSGKSVPGKSVRSPWEAAPAENVLMLPGNRPLVPDFVFRRQEAGTAETGTLVYLEHLAYPVAERVTARLEQLRAAGRNDYLLACRGVPAIRALKAPCPPLIAYRRTLLPSTVREALDALERSRGEAG